MGDEAPDLLSALPAVALDHDMRDEMSEDIIDEVAVAQCAVD